MKNNVIGLENAIEEVFFVSPSQEEEVFHQRDLIQLFPFGLSVSAEIARPFLLLKDKTHTYTLPVALNPLEAGVTLTQSNQQIAPLTPHRFTEVLLKKLGIELKQCVFVEIKGQTQWVRAYMSGHPDVQSIKFKAEDAMSLCLHLNIPLFATKSFIDKSKILSAEIDTMAKQLVINPAILGRNQRYMM